MRDGVRRARANRSGESIGALAPLLSVSYFRRRQSVLWGMADPVPSFTQHGTTIRIQTGGRRHGYFQVELDTCRTIAAGATFDIVCRLESGLAVPFQATKSPGSEAVDWGARRTSLGASRRKIRVRFFGRLDAGGIRGTRSGTLTTIVVDERPADQSPADRSAHLCEQ